MMYQSLQLPNLTLARKAAFRLYLLACVSDICPLRILRRTLLSYILGKRLEHVVIDGSVRITGVQNLRLGRNVSIHHYSFIIADGGITIGNDVSIGHQCSLLSTNHGFEDKTIPIKSQPVTGKPIIIADNVWLGANVTLLAGVVLGPGTVVAAGSVVTKSFDEGYVVIGGVPARILRRY